MEESPEEGKKPHIDELCAQMYVLLDKLLSKILEYEAAAREDPGFSVPDDDFPYRREVELVNVFESYGKRVQEAWHADSSGTLPGDCPYHTAQFAAWKLGQAVARYVLSHGSRQSAWKGFEHIYGWLTFEAVEQGDFTQEEAEAKRSFAAAAGALVAEYDPSRDRDWLAYRGYCTEMWRYSYIYSDTPFTELGPHTDLFWAMRIGFADALLAANGMTDALRCPSLHLGAMNRKARPRSVGWLFRSGPPSCARLLLHETLYPASEQTTLGGS